MKVVRVLVAFTLGLFSGFLIYVADAMLFTGSASSAEAVLLRGWAVFIGGWAISGSLLLWGTRTTTQVFKRGFLLGAVEWLGMIPVMFSGKQPSLTMTRWAGVAGLMAVACLVGFAVVYFVVREVKSEISGPTTR